MDRAPGAAARRPQLKEGDHAVANGPRPARTRADTERRLASSTTGVQPPEGWSTHGRSRVAAPTLGVRGPLRLVGEEASADEAPEPGKAAKPGAAGRMQQARGTDGQRRGLAVRSCRHPEVQAFSGEPTQRLAWRACRVTAGRPWRCATGPHYHRCRWSALRKRGRWVRCCVQAAPALEWATKVRKRRVTRESSQEVQEEAGTAGRAQEPRPQAASSHGSTSRTTGAAAEW